MPSKELNNASKRMVSFLRRHKGKSFTGYELAKRTGLSRSVPYIYRDRILEACPDISVDENKKFMCRRSDPSEWASMGFEDWDDVYGYICDLVNQIRGREKVDMEIARTIMSGGK